MQYIHFTNCFLKSNSFSLRPFYVLNVGQGRTRQKYNSIIFVRFDYEKIKLRKIADLTEFCQN